MGMGMFGTGMGMGVSKRSEKEEKSGREVRDLSNPPFSGVVFFGAEIPLGLTRSARSV